LDGVRETSLPSIGAGLLSRSGWFFYDDSARPLIDPSTQWLAKRPDPDALDWFFCVYGHDYRRALLLASDLLGHVLLPPKWAFGAWYSRYWPFTDAEERGIVTKFRELGIPLDVLVIDVDWHLHGWEGYDWNPELFPDPEGFLRWVHKQGCKVTLNNHPGRLPRADSHFAEVCRRIGVEPAGLEEVHFNLADRTHAAAFMEVLHKPLHKQGVDFWWIDGSSAHMDGLDSQMWTSKVYFDFTEEFTGKRGLLFARYGNHGSHRYPVGFSGDTFSEWGVLGYEVMFTVRAANVLYPYWSHDIGGFMGNRLPTELYVRWVQFGALSPVLRLHSNHGVREPWEYGNEGIETAKKFFRLRYQLLPYIYSYARRVYETGEPLCKPLYIDWPEEEEAYVRDDEYLFGDAILVAPIVEPATNGRIARREVWLPPGEWVSLDTHEAYGSGGVACEADLQTLPMFLRKGSIVVMDEEATDYVKEAADQNLTALVTVGGPEAVFTLYEDDGESKEYQKDKFAKTELKLVATSSSDQVLTIAPTKGRYEGQAAERAWRVAVVGRFAPEQVLLDGKPMRRCRESEERLPIGAWCWCADKKLINISLPRRPIDAGYKVELRGGAGSEEYTVFWEAMRLARHLRQALGNVENLQGTWDDLRVEASRTAAKAENIARRVEQGEMRAHEARIDLRRLKERDVEHVADIAARGAASDTVRFEAVSNILGVSLSGRIETEDGGRLTRLRPVVLRANLAPAAVKRFLESLHERQGARWPDVDKELAFGPYYPVGKFEASLQLRGQWAGLPFGTSISDAVDASALQVFHLVGPFDNTGRKGLDTSYPPELALEVGAQLEGKAGPVKWLQTGWRCPPRHHAEPHFVNLEALFDPKEFTVAYAVAYVWAPQEQDALVLIGTDDECKLWVNGQHVHTFPDPRPPEPDQDKVPVRLRSGWNTLLLKVCQEQGQWGFYMRLTGPDEKPLRGLWTALAPEGTPPREGEL
jgi:hypothetical protein